MLRVYYVGDGDDEEKGFEGWLDSDEVSPSAAPRWVITRQDTGLWRDPSAIPALSTWMPARIVLEVLQEAGQRVRVFDLGDGLARDLAEGWVEGLDLGAASAMLAAERRGVSLLSASDVASLQSGNGLWLKVPHRSQLDGSPSADANCGPVSVAMALMLFDRFVPTAELRARANRLQGTSGPDVGFRIEHLRSLAEQFGLKGLDLYTGQVFRRWTLEDVRHHLRQGHPVIPQLRYRLMPGRAGSGFLGDHYVVLAGLRGEDFIYNDSVDSDGPGYGRMMSAETLARAWGGSDYPFAGFAVTRP